ncbi:MAG: hypothetical protein N5P05_002317 [Chroococcopsis gigantea SAG 12.99]|nr:hypothetical protein [Chlorogloea purpurea SAG 13.99]MDV3000711.1 hypothetical protein [Chroococcopsis gigantea SAG 12.99]
MTGRLNKLQRELNNLENLTAELAIKIKAKYEVYIKQFNESFYKQFILATYQISTQKYPAAFLNLTYSQREQLQQELKAIARDGQKQLLDLLEIKYANSSTVSIQIKGLQPPPLTPDNLKEDIELTKSPYVLWQWCREIETGIGDILQKISKEANQRLQQWAILPLQLPPQVLDMAIQAQQDGQPVSGGNNLLNVLVGADNTNLEAEVNREETIGPGGITQITAIYLRVAEIEFADPSISVERNQIRNLVEQIHNVGKQYNKTEQEYSIAQAESAWRTSWYDP